MSATRVFTAFFVFFPAFSQAQIFERYLSYRSSDIRAWANSCNVERGFIDISDTSKTFTFNGISSNRAFFGTDSMAVGSVDEASGVVSLGDGGIALLTFPHPICNGEGADFVVFENGLQSGSGENLYFLEPAFVEVSSDGINFVRFPAISTIPTSKQLNAFDFSAPEMYQNIAVGFSDYGTCFDLDELLNEQGLDINKITHIKIVDIPGSLHPEYAVADIEGNVINAPFPTPFHTCGFDLNGVGVLHFSGNEQDNTSSSIRVYPNPSFVSQKACVVLFRSENALITIFDSLGRKVFSAFYTNFSEAEFAFPNAGIYFIRLKSEHAVATEKLIVK